ncbi:MAG: PPC domain-containing protein [Candidatus Eisenbacteria bacterium]|uniref:PPC domain-containing protein n=1 Tax=Eiseniibacteriota bacterium TaxID=2212470 RepID=A0A948RSA0_UNCEI|nr:PPC domain-containing protein [Candidatus Eisenbacteria bacterium]MBU1949293.1 PPC domain-containing protein [Candidatus Eisenbacteria bacterium]MBU2690078.1 PPC domain-containing protein [Candidatus Eisenbacteria bacterium]
MKTRNSGLVFILCLFTILLVGATGIASAEDSFEPNNTIEDAYPIESGITYESWISVPGDVDLYTFEVTIAGAIDISLTSLPADYDLYLFRYNPEEDSWDWVAFSNNWGSEDEEIHESNMPTGTYIIDIEGYEDVYDANDSYLLLATYPEGITPIQITTWGSIKLNYTETR